MRAGGGGWGIVAHFATQTITNHRGSWCHTAHPPFIHSVLLGQSNTVLHNSPPPFPIPSAKCHPSPPSSMLCGYAMQTEDMHLSYSTDRPQVFTGPAHITPHQHHNLAIKTSGKLASWSQDEEYVPVPHFITPSSRSTSSLHHTPTPPPLLPPPQHGYPSQHFFECWMFGRHCIPQRLCYAWSSKPLYRP